MSFRSDSADFRPAIAGDVERFTDLDDLVDLMRAEHPVSPFVEAGVIQGPGALIADGTGVHLRMNPDLMDGELAIYRALPGISVSILNFVPKDVDTIHEIGTQAVPQEDELMIRLFQYGQVVYRFGDVVVDSAVSPGVISFQPEAGRFSYHMRAGDSIRTTFFSMTEKGEREIWHRFGIPPSPLFQELRTGAATEDRVFELPRNDSFKQFSESLLHLPESGSARTTMLRLKVGELFCLLSDVRPIHNTNVSGDVPLIEVRKLARARSILEERDGEALSIAKLSTMVGLNRRKLTEGFKKIYGDTVAGYALELRMRKGYQLLKESPLAVHKIAEECGYEHPSNFTIAFKRRFSSSPSEVRSSR